MKNEFILAFRHIGTNEMLYFYVTAFKQLEKEWLIIHENTNKTIWKAAVELIGTQAESNLKGKDHIYYPFEFNTALL